MFAGVLNRLTRVDMRCKTHRIGLGVSGEPAGVGSRTQTEQWANTGLTPRQHCLKTVDGRWHESP
jgi:hypothetical protein